MLIRQELLSCFIPPTLGQGPYLGMEGGERVLHYSKLVLASREIRCLPEDW